jgi:tetratricopeptide (TPR) repeat protein
MGKKKSLKQRDPMAYQEQWEPEVTALRDRKDLISAILICTVLAAVTLAVYWQVTHFELLSFDDETYVSANDFVRNGISVANVGEAFRFNAYAGNWHPITWLSLMLDTTLYGPTTAAGPSGLEVEGYHLTNLLLHIANTVLVFFFSTWLTKSNWRGGFVAGLFALHPLHVESVAWVAERKDVLSTFFWLLTTLVYISYARSARSADGRSNRISNACGKYALLLFLFAMGLMSKPMLVTLPFTLILLDFWPLRRISLKTEADPRPKNAPKLSRADKYLPLVEKIPLFAMSLASAVVTMIMQREGGAVTTIQGVTLPMRFATGCVACIAYLIKMIWPYHLAAIYPYPVRQDSLTGVIYTLSPVTVAAAALALVAITIAAIRLRRKLPYLTFGWLWYLVTLLPVLGFIQVGYQRWADRYTYVPLLGIFIILACGLPELRWTKSRRLRVNTLTTCAIVVLATFAYLTHGQAAWWHDSKKLYQRALAVTTDNWFMRNALGRTLLKEDEGIINAKGPDAQAYRITTEAQDQLERGVQIDSGIADIHNNLGVANRALSLFSAFGEDPTRRLQDAANEFKEALRIDSKLGDAALNLGLTLTQLGKQDEAITVYKQLLQLPDLTAGAAYWARLNLAAIVLANGQKDESIQLLKEAAGINATTQVDPVNQATQRLRELGAVGQ